MIDFGFTYVVILNIYRISKGFGYFLEYFLLTGCLFCFYINDCYLFASVRQETLPSSVDFISCQQFPSEFLHGDDKKV